MGLASSKSQNIMRKISVGKVVINVGVGKSGEPVERAKHGLEDLTSKVPTVTTAKKNFRDFGIHKGEPIGAKVTLRRNDATDFLRRCLEAKSNKININSFDDFGNISMGIHEHIDIPGTKYNPDIGIFGMNVCVSLIRPGYSISLKRRKSKIGKEHRIRKEGAIEFFTNRFGVEIT
jgi:large subunit ribosomal protein L5